MIAAALLTIALATSEPCADPRVLQLGEIGSVSRERARVLELSGMAPLRPRLFERWSSDPELRVCDLDMRHPSELEPESRPNLQLGLAPATLRAIGHGGWSDDRNDGALWAGKGVSSSLSAGVRLRWRWFSAQFAPLVAWQQNEPFRVRSTTTPESSPWANPFYESSIDLPVRFGPGAFWSTDPGQSWVRADVWNVAVGLSTENLWWGPGVRDSLLMTNSAPGFPHVFVGTSRPADVWIGWLEVQALWGHLRESKWFDGDSANDTRLYSALTVGFEPRIVPGLFLGMARTFQLTIPPGGVPWNRYVRPLFESFEKVDLGPGIDERGDNQVTSFFARWAFQPVGFEVYGEWGRDDHAWDMADFVTQPEHGQAYMFGAQKAWRGVRGGVLRFSAEFVNTFEKPAPNPPRAVPVFFTSSWARQGYTNDGQMLGAGLGPAANAQSVALDWFGARSRFGIFAERRLRNQRYFYDQIALMAREDVELAADLRWTVTRGDFELDTRVGAARRLNANFEHDVGAPRGSVTVTWMPPAL